MAAPDLDALARELSGCVLTGAEILEAARADKSGYVSTGPPLALVEAGTIADVQATMRFASEHGIPVVPRGAGTGLAGAATGGPGEIVLSTLAMNEVLEISTTDLLAVVQPGVINGDLNDQLAPLGLWFAPDPASRAISTVGGNIATNAGGLLCMKYGVTREAVLGLTVVLADGRLLELGRRSVKGVTGYDLTALMVGSEGTLGVIVEATVRLRPLPVGEVATLSAAFEDVVAGATAASALVAAGVDCAVLELLDGACMAALESYWGRDLGGGALLIAQLDGGAAEQEAGRAGELLRMCGGRVEVTRDRDRGEELFAVRRSLHFAIERLGTVLIEDVAVPRSALGAMFEAIGEIERRYGISIPTVAHAGDGNLHPNLVVATEPGADPNEVPDHIWAAADELFSACLRLGGTLTGEHGVGLLKKRWLRDELGQDSYDLQRDLKAVFDPQGILNPGKVYEW
ncbi:FAD-binding oxidoreductase [Pseudactinotalea sp.]|uniref:FAD-binding oxidoreductase n=1 Tax=Pseudactinotalea sp. TaxID=1926260 RepID=UPI003B3BCE4E